MVALPTWDNIYKSLGLGSPDTISANAGVVDGVGYDSHIQAYYAMQEDSMVVNKDETKKTIIMLSIIGLGFYMFMKYKKGKK